MMDDILFLSTFHRIIVLQYDILVLKLLLTTSLHFIQQIHWNYNFFYILKIYVNK